ncbi:MAG: hypothetical protein A3K10_10920 [Bacteroidetes bacterium RIFCSPLOWO2_12_FULL_31_6]|nr:MAG: hypothetical protein A3K10_10920 [Bacteroidetes bacterium RIFCSPLOWO2_12_FULL_31_6]
MVKKIVIMILFSPLFLDAQETDGNIAKNGLLRTTGTISFGRMAKEEQTNIYLQGVLEYFVTKNITSRGDVYHYLKSGDQQILNINHQLFAGTSYHFNTNSNFIPYIGIQPGIALTQANFVTIDGSNNLEINPLISAVGGFNYYASKWFHLFIDVRYVTGKHLSHQKVIALDEVRLSFGLAFMF